MLLTYNVVAYRELLRQGVGGEVLKIRWWFTGGASLKGLFSRAGGTGKGRVFEVLGVMGRRDFFVFAWLVLALLDLGPIVLVYALGVALLNFVVAVGQLLWRNRPG
jgi:hypothetical protein